MQFSNRILLAIIGIFTKDQEWIDKSRNWGQNYYNPLICIVNIFIDLKILIENILTLGYLELAEKFSFEQYCLCKSFVYMWYANTVNFTMT